MTTIDSDMRLNITYYSVVCMWYDMYSWSIDGNDLYFHHPKGDIFWKRPPGYRLPSNKLLSLASFILLTPYGESVEVLPRHHMPGSRVAVAYPGGVDSSGALELLPNALPIYTQVARPRKPLGAKNT